MSAAGYRALGIRDVWKLLSSYQGGWTVDVGLLGVFLDNLCDEWFDDGGFCPSEHVCLTYATMQAFFPLWWQQYGARGVKRVLAHDRSKSKDYATRLTHFAILYNHTTLLKVLAAEMQENIYPQHWWVAAYLGHMETILVLSRSYPAQYTALAFEFAAAGGQLHVVKFLHRSRFPVGSRGLSAACEMGHLHIVRYYHEHVDLLMNATFPIVYQGTRGRDAICFFLNQNGYTYKVESGMCRRSWNPFMTPSIACLASNLAQTAFDIAVDMQQWHIGYYLYKYPLLPLNDARIHTMNKKALQLFKRVKKHRSFNCSIL